MSISVIAFLMASYARSRRLVLTWIGAMLSRMWVSPDSPPRARSPVRRTAVLPTSDVAEPTRSFPPIAMIVSRSNGDGADQPVSISAQSFTKDFAHPLARARFPQAGIRARAGVRNTVYCFVCQPQQLAAYARGRPGRGRGAGGRLRL